MEEKELTPYEQNVVAILDEIKELFLTKNRAYNGNNPFTNFIIGGLLLHGDAGFFGCFEALKAYVTKHISNVYSHNINTPGLEESMRDIATYMVIAMAMKRQNDAVVAAAQQQQQQQDAANAIPVVEPEVEEVETDDRAD